VRETPTSPDYQLEKALGRIAHLEATLASAHATVVKLTAERDKLRRAYEQVKEQLELLRRRLYVAKAERVDTTQLQLEFAETQAKLDALATQLEEATPPSDTLEAPGWLRFLRDVFATAAVAGDRIAATSDGMLASRMLAAVPSSTLESNHEAQLHQQLFAVELYASRICLAT
jgi:hypothetical protein